MLLLALCHLFSSLPAYEYWHMCNEVTLRAYGYCALTVPLMTMREADVYTLHRALGVDAVSYEFMQKQLARMPAMYVIVCHEPKKEIMVMNYTDVARYQVMSDDSIVTIQSIVGYCHGRYRVFVDGWIRSYTQ